MEITITIPEALVSNARASGLSPETYVERLLNQIASEPERSEPERAKLSDEQSRASELFK